MGNFRVYNADGSLQVSENQFAMGLVTSGTLTLVDDGATHPQPMVVGSIQVNNATNPVIAILPPDSPFASSGAGAINQVRVTVSGNNFTFHYRAKSNSPITFQYWVFDVATKAMKDSTMTNAGIRVFDSAGVLTFDAAMPVLRIADYKTLSMPPHDSPPGSIPSPTTTVAVPTGRTYAIISSFLGYAVTMYDAGGYGDQPGGAIIRDPDAEPPLPGSYQWKSMYLESNHSGIRRSGSTLQMGLYQFEYFYGWYPGTTEEHFWSFGQLGFAIVDVTDFISSSGGGGGGTLTVTVNATSQTASQSSAGTTVTTGVTASATGGTAPFTYQWQLVEGSSNVIAYGSTATTATLRTQVTSQAVGTVYEAVYRCRIQDSTGKVGYSPNVTFRHEVVGPDYTANPITLPVMNVTSNEHDAWFTGTPVTITGINQPITIRCERYNYSGNMDACYVDVFTKAPGGDWVHRGYFIASESGYRSLDISVTNNTQVRMDIHGVSSMGRKTAQMDLLIWNLSVAPNVNLGGSVANTFAVDNDNNYNIISTTGGGNTAGVTNDATIETAWAYLGVHGAVGGRTIRVTRSAATTTGNLNNNTVIIAHRPYSGGTTTYLELAPSSYLDIAITGDWMISYLIRAGTSSYKATTSSTLTFRDLTRSVNFYTATASATVDNDNNYAPAGINPVDWPNLSKWHESTNGSSSTPNTATGAARTVSLSGTATITLSASGVTGEAGVAINIIKNGVNQGTKLNIPQYSNTVNTSYTPVTVANGDSIAFQLAVSGPLADNWTPYMQVQRYLTVHVTSNPGGVVDTFFVDATHSDYYSSGGGPGGPIEI